MYFYTNIFTANMSAYKNDFDNSRNQPSLFYVCVGHFSIATTAQIYIYIYIYTIVLVEAFRI